MVLVLLFISKQFKILHMKRILSIITVFTLLLTSCSDAEDGQDGVNFGDNLLKEQ